MSDIEIARGYLPGSIGRVAELHGTYYHEHWSFGLFFEIKVATDIAAFLERYDGERDGFWTAVRENRVEGAIAIDGVHGEEEGAHLRWFIVSPAWCGRGIGSRLVRTAIDFCRKRAYPRIYLWTFEGLGAARHIYEKAGFTLVEQRRGTQWGTEVNEQRYELSLL